MQKEREHTGDAFTGDVGQDGLIVEQGHQQQKGSHVQRISHELDGAVPDKGQDFLRMTTMWCSANTRLNGYSSFSTTLSTGISASGSNWRKFKPPEIR